MSAEDLTTAPDVELRLPADAAFAYVLRSTAAALAARVDFTLDDIEDLRIAVSEALSLLLEGVPGGAGLRVGFHLSPGRLDLALSVPSTAPHRIDREGFAWQVLTTLAEETSVAHRDEQVELRLTLRSSVQTVRTA